MAPLKTIQRTGSGFGLALLICLAGCPEARRQTADGGAAAQENKPPPRWPAAQARWGPLTRSRWAEVERLARLPVRASEQGDKQAVALAQAGIAAARKAGNSADWTMGLIWRQTVEQAQKQNNTEASLDTYRRTPWPDDLPGRVATTFFYVHRLALYAHQYSGFIARRQDKHSPDRIKTWTQQQLRREALTRLEPLWRHRIELAQQRQAPLAEVLPKEGCLEDRGGTLRDSLSCLLVQVLAQTSWWSDTERTAAPSLDARSRPPRPDQVTRPGAHPLARIAAVLDDLAAWHRSAGRRQAALEARLHKLETLHLLQADPRTRRRLRAALAAEARQLQGKPGEARAMASLVAATLTPPEADRPAALAIARACQRLDKRPSRAGAPSEQRRGAVACKHLEQVITAPELSLSTSSTQAPGRPSLALTSRNLKEVHLRAYRVRWPDLLNGSGLSSRLTEERIEKMVAQAAPAASWRVSPAHPNAHAPRRTLITPPLTELGPYLVLASARANFARRDNVIQGTLLVLTDLVLVRQHEPNRVTVTAISASTGQPLPGVKISCHRWYWRTPAVVIKQQTTDAAGQAQFTRFAASFFHHFSGQKGPDRTFHTDAAFRRRDTQRGDLRLVLTDQQVYRRGQQLRFKLFALRVPGHGREAAPMRQQRVGLRLEDAEEVWVASQVVTTNAFGTASGAFTLPTFLPGDAARLEVSGDYGEHGLTRVTLSPSRRGRGPAAAPAAGAAAATGAGLTLKVASNKLRVGQVAAVSISGPRGPQPLFVSLYNHGALLEQRRASLASGSARLEIPVTAAHRGGLGVVAWTVRGHRLLSGTATIAVSRANKQLELALSPARPRLKQGQRLRLKVTVKRPPPGSPRAELLAALVAAEGQGCERPPFGPGDLLDRLGLASPPVATPGRPIVIKVATKGFTQPADLPLRLGHLRKLARLPSLASWLLQPQRYTTPVYYGSRGGIGPKHPFGPGLKIVRPALHEAASPTWRAGLRAAGCGGSKAPLLFTQHLVTDANGSATIELKAPARAGRYRLRLLATSVDLASGALTAPVDVVR